MGAPGATHDEPKTDYQRLESQIEWYDQKSGDAQKRYKWVKAAEFMSSAFVPMTALIYPKLTALLGVLVVVLEGLQQLNQWQHNWITYRSTCEALRHEKYSYLGHSGSYEGFDEGQAKRTLIERVESLISTEHSKWISRQEYELGKQVKSSRSIKEDKENG